MAYDSASYEENVKNACALTAIHGTVLKRQKPFAM